MKRCTNWALKNHKGRGRRHRPNASFPDHGSHVREALLDRQIACSNYAYESGVDRPEETGWTWPF